MQHVCKEIFYYRKIIASSLAVLFIFANFLVCLTKYQFWAAPGSYIWDNLLDTIVLTALFIYVWVYCSYYGEQKIEVGRYEETISIIFNKCFFYAAIYGVILYLAYWYYKGYLWHNQEWMTLLFGAVFILSPLFWIKLFWNFGVTIFNFLTPFAIAYWSLDSVEKENRKRSRDTRMTESEEWYYATVISDMITNSVKAESNFSDMISTGPDKATIPLYLPKENRTENGIMKLDSKVRRRTYLVVFLFLLAVLAPNITDNVAQAYRIHNAKSRTFFTKLPSSEKAEKEGDWEYVGSIDNWDHYFDKNTLVIHSDTKTVEVILRGKQNVEQPNFSYYLVCFQYPKSKKTYAIIDNYNVNVENPDEYFYHIREVQDQSIIGLLYNEINYLYRMDLLKENREKDDSLEMILEKLKNNDMHIENDQESNESFFDSLSSWFSRLKMTFTKQMEKHKADLKEKKEAEAKREAEEKAKYEKYAAIAGAVRKESYTGKDQRLVNGTKCVINVPNVIFKHSNGDEVAYSASQEERDGTIFVIKESDTIGFWVKGVLIKSVVGVDDETKEKFKFEEGSPIRIRRKQVNEESKFTGKYYCAMPKTKDGKSFDMILRRSYFQIDTNDEIYWYQVQAENKEFDNLWIEGKYLTPVRELEAE